MWRKRRNGSAARSRSRSQAHDPGEGLGAGALQAAEPGARRASRSRRRRSRSRSPRPVAPAARRPRPRRRWRSPVLEQFARCGSVPASIAACRAGSRRCRALREAAGSRPVNIEACDGRVSGMWRVGVGRRGWRRGAGASIAGVSSPRSRLGRKVIGAQGVDRDQHHGRVSRTAREPRRRRFEGSADTRRGRTRRRRS